MFPQLRLLEDADVPAAAGEDAQDGVPPVEWYNTPNIHFCTIEDFDAYCDRFDLRVERRIYFSNDRGGRVLRGVRPNLFAESAVYLLAKA